jgi:hypothetical protein
MARHKASTPIDTAPMLSVCAGQVCIGHILRRGKTGFEAYDADDKLIGTFDSQSNAAAAISKAVRR